MIQIDALPAFSDNYIWLLQDVTTRTCAVVDPGDAAPVEAWLAAHPGWRLADILVTHHHQDHVGGVARLKQTSGARVLGPAGERIPAIDQALRDGDQVEVLGLGFEVIEVPRSACTVCGAKPLRSIASAMKSAASRESSTGEMIQDGLNRE